MGHFYMKITLIPSNLVINLLLCFLLEKPKIRINFSASWWSGNKKYFCVLFIASRTLRQRYAEFNRLLWKNFLICFSCSYYSSMGIPNFGVSMVIFNSVAIFRRWCKLNFGSWKNSHEETILSFLTKISWNN